MMVIEHDHTIPDSQQLHVVNVVHSCHVCCTLDEDDREREHDHHAAHIVKSIAADRLGKHVVVYIIDVPQRADRFHNSIHAFAYLLVQVVVKVQEGSQNALPNVNRPR